MPTPFPKQAARASRLLNRKTNQIDAHAIGALAFVSEGVTNDAKDPGRPLAWIDQTGNLRRSITWRILMPGESKALTYQTRTMGVQAARATSFFKGGPISVVFAGMRYGIYVQAKPSRDIFEQAIAKWRPMLSRMMKDFVKDGVRKP